MEEKPYAFVGILSIKSGILHILFLAAHFSFLMPYSMHIIYSKLEDELALENKNSFKTLMVLKQKLFLPPSLPPTLSLIFLSFFPSFLPPLHLTFKISQHYDQSSENFHTLPA
jgi:hypothetical protein